MMLLHLFTQIIVVLAVTAGCGWLVQRVRQPSVIGQIAGGLLLGPLLLGQIAPRLQIALFPPDTLGWLEQIGRIGLVLFLFLIGAELDLRSVRNHGRVVSAITAGSVVVPFALGIAVAPLLWHRFPSSSSYVAFALFIGVAMSITALPVLASMLRARTATKRPVPHDIAALVLVSASVNDVVAWCLLAAVLTLLHGTRGWQTVAPLAQLLLFVGVMLGVVRPGVRRLLKGISSLQAAVALVGLAFAAAAVTEWLGLHSFVGAIGAGACVPRDGEAEATLHKMLRRWSEPVIRTTLPLFFALTGLRMEPGLFRADGLGYLLLIVLVAVAGKVVGAAASARACGFSWQQGLRIGVLLNTRGLVELIVLNVGYRERVLSAGLFTLFVLMSLLTTAMTAPLLNLWRDPETA